MDVKYQEAPPSIIKKVTIPIADSSDDDDDYGYQFEPQSAVLLHPAEMVLQQKTVQVTGQNTSTIEVLLNLLESRKTPDHLHLSQIATVQQTLSRIEGAGAADYFPEIRFSDYVQKMNRKGKIQQRVIVLTKTHLYNILPNNYKTVKRAIAVDKLSRITLGEDSDDFVLHVSDEYDYWFNSLRRAQLVRLIARTYQQLTGQELPAETALPKKLTMSINTKPSPKLSDTLKKTLSLDSTPDQQQTNAGKTTASPMQEQDSTLYLNSTKTSQGLTGKLRTLVSKKKNRFTEDGFDLDLSYISERIIAMGFPSEDLEGMYRNPMNEVVRFLETRHPNKYKVYNLCSERRYDPKKFQMRVAIFPFDDHNAPPFKIMLDFCENVAAWLSSDPENVIAVHCKAGKGRTGTLICCYMLYSQMFSTAQQSLEYFGRKRTMDGKGVTIPSQSRYVQYFEIFLHQYFSPGRPFPWTGVPLVLTNMRFTSCPHFGADGGCDPYFKIVSQQGIKVYESRQTTKVQHWKQNSTELFDIAAAARISGDVKIQVLDEDKYSMDTPMFHFWIHTGFVQDNYLRLTKYQLDKAHKDKHHKKFDADFCIELFFRTDDVAAAAKTAGDGIASQAERPAEVNDDVAELKERILELESEIMELNSQLGISTIQIEDLREENARLIEENEQLQARRHRNSQASQRQFAQQFFGKF